MGSIEVITCRYSLELGWPGAPWVMDFPETTQPVYHQRKPHIADLREREYPLGEMRVP
jgi:hypothetical protein